MIELVRLFPHRSLVLSIAAWMFFFALQIVFLTVVAYERYDPPAESRLLLDRVWFIYTELPRALPMAAVYAVCAVFVVQVIGRFIAQDNPQNPTIGQLRQSLKERPVKAITWMGIRLVFLLALAGLFLGPVGVSAALGWFCLGRFCGDPSRSALLLLVVRLGSQGSNNGGRQGKPAESWALLLPAVHRRSRSGAARVGSLGFLIIPHLAR